MRTEKDFLGAKEVPVNAYYGINTVRAMENFRVSRQLVHPELIRAMATVKQAAVEMNMSLGLLDARLGSAIFQAAAEIADGNLADMLDVQRDIRDIMLAMRRCPQPIIALLHGAAAVHVRRVHRAPRWAEPAVTTMLPFIPAS